MSKQPSSESRASLEIDGDKLRLTGTLDFATVVPIAEQGLRWLEDRGPGAYRLELGGVDYSNSAGVALILAWLREAQRLGGQLRLEKVPDNLASMIQLGGLDNALLGPTGNDS